MAAAIATWQSAYVTRDAAATPGDGAAGDRNVLARSNTDNSLDRSGAGAGGSGGHGGYGAGGGGGGGLEGTDSQPERKKTVVRQGGGKKWQDDSLLEWDPSHFRIFVGNLGGETTDTSLLNAFSRWSSVSKARVIRDKTTNKSKGYGFVSFADADDFFSAAKEMSGKYIGSHPVVIRKANTEIKVTNVKDKDNHHNNWRNKNRNRNNNKNNNNNDDNNGNNNNGGNGNNSNNVRDKYKDEGGDGSKYDAGHGAGVHSGRITKPGQKTKNGLKLLG